ncbi:Efflux pump [Lachnellula hyalina]|uniref:Efflux pump n=1 Tax=Lachnellula hyalina TaxID=1316788 RepID=A0A8H8R8S5_9HELO|nr:Efflux pump [Lachnellula hyalina]TVY29781.1 Efflux pump [Lachnellula hyalina]
MPSSHSGDDSSGLHTVGTKQEEDHDLEPVELTQSKVERPKSLPREIAFILIICMAQLMTQAGLGQVIAPLHIIGRSFGVEDSPAQLSWFPAAYSLTVGTFILIAGRLGDLYGHKKLFVAGFLWFALWTMLAGFAVYSNPVFFDCCRAFQGIGPAFLLPNGVAILGRAYEPGLRKQMAFSAFGAMAPSGFAFGAAISSLFAEFVWWPWGFWVMAMLCLLLGVASIFLIPHTPAPQFDNTHSFWVRADIAGCITGVSGLVLINFAWNQAPVVGWSNPYVGVLLIIGIILLGIFGQIEKRATFPLVPFSSMTPDLGFILGCVACGWAAFGIWVFYSWQFIEELRGVSPLLGAAQFSPTVISGCIAAFTTGSILHRVPGSVVMMIALGAFCIGSILVGTMPVSQTYWAQLFVSQVVMPWGMDMSFPAATLLLSNAMPRKHQGVAASLVNTIINYSISLALGFAGTIETHVNYGGKDVLRGYRGALYLGIGLAGLGVVLAMFFGLYEHRGSRKNKNHAEDAASSDDKERSPSE